MKGIGLKIVVAAIVILTTGAGMAVTGHAGSSASAGARGGDATLGADVNAHFGRYETSVALVTGSRTDN